MRRSLAISGPIRDTVSQRSSFASAHPSLAVDGLRAQPLSVHSHAHARPPHFCGGAPSRAPEKRRSPASPHQPFTHQPGFFSFSFLSIIKLHLVFISKRLVADFPTSALDLAAEYGVYDWIAALLDNRHIAQDGNAYIAPPPLFKPLPLGKNHSRNGSMSARNRTASRELRSMSPVKQSAPTPNKPKATPRKRRSKKQAEAAESIADSADEADGILGAAAEVADAVGLGDSGSTKPLDEKTIRISVTQDVITGDDDVDTTRTNLKVELPADAPDLTLPTDTEAMVEKAAAMIESAKELPEGTTEVSVSPKARKSAKSHKRKASSLEDDAVRGPEEIVQEIAHGEATSLATGEVEMHGRATKRTRIMVPAEEYRREKVKRRALMGLSGALAVGLVFHCVRPGMPC